jgi:hypothetical protein
VAAVIVLEVEVVIALVVGVAVATNRVTLVDGVALVAGLGAEVVCVVFTVDRVKLATAMLDVVEVALDTVAGADADVEAGAGVAEADTLDAGVTAAL